MSHARYRKHNDGSHNSSTYHKKDGTNVRAIEGREAREEVREDLNHLRDLKRRVLRVLGAEGGEK